MQIYIKNVKFPSKNQVNLYKYFNKTKKKQPNI